MFSTKGKLFNKILNYKIKIFNKLGIYDYMRAHKIIIKKHLLEILKKFPNPIVIETGCIRMLNEGTESTLTISSTLKGRGDFYTFEINKEHIKICKKICKDYNRNIRYIVGDSIISMKKIIKSGKLMKIHFAFLDSVNDAEHIWKEFKTIENLFIKNSIVIVDDVLWAEKGKLVKPYLEKSDAWKTEIYNVENGILVAEKVK